MAGSQTATLIAAHQTSKANTVDGDFIKIAKNDYNRPFKPLDKIQLQLDKAGKILVFDGNGIKYIEQDVDEKIHLQAAGALGTNLIFLVDKKDAVIDIASFKTDAKTEIKDKGDEFREMLDMLHFSTRQGYGSGRFQRIEEDIHFTYAGWYQDHVHVFKGMKYFYPDVKSGIDLWAKSQREDGMLADNNRPDMNSYKSWLNRFGERFVWKIGEETNTSTHWVRIPVENMSEFTFLEAVYYSWKASGDDEWMAGKIENCLKAIKYSTTDDYRWSEKFQLLKRGYTIDIWDFQSAQDVEVWGGDIMMAKPGVTNFSVMYGDNVGFFVGCEYVSEMLDYLGRKDEAAEIMELAKDIKKRLDDLSWNGEFYTHHVEEDPNVKRDFGGTDVDSQVTISSGYAINRRIGHDKSVALIKTYQRIKDEMPKTSPGEWYMCYPPYEKGWHNPKWEYMNGGVTSIVAGEVAHGAFWHGFEDYGVDVLRRTNKMAKELSGNFMKCIYRGAMPEKPERNFTPVSFKDVVNADTHGDKGAKGVPAFTGEGTNDMHEFPVGKYETHDVPFDFIDPAANGRKACLIISGEEEYTKNASLEVGKKAGSVYIVHAQSHGNYMGDVVLIYDDGSRHTEHVVRGQNIAGWWYPGEKGRRAKYKLAWEGKNDKSISIGTFLWGFNNPNKDKTITSIDFKGIDGNEKWIVMGLTLCDEPVFYMPSPISYGAPDNWGAAAVIYALIEGLAGIKDTGVAFNKATLAPRWEAAGVDEVEATAKYEASGGYLAYKYKKENNNLLNISFTGSSTETKVNILVPAGKSIVSIVDNGQRISDIEMVNVEDSKYASMLIKGVNAHNLKIELS